MKFRGVTTLLNNIVRDSQSQRRLHTVINGSHINIHSDDGQGFTVVRPHGGKTELPPSVVNRLINNALNLLSEN